MKNGNILRHILAGFDHQDLPPVRRDRGHTISVMSPVVGRFWLPGTKTTQHRVQEAQPQGINPR